MQDLVKKYNEALKYSQRPASPYNSLSHKIVREYLSLPYNEAKSCDV